MAVDENPIKTCWYCKKKFDGNFEIRDFSIICPYCKRPQSSVFEKDSQAEIIRKSKKSINKSKADFKKSQSAIPKKNTVKSLGFSAV
ncbi:MAG: hypothetical protein V1859_06765 [archaeon]